jgi:hypothetical protein
MPLPDIPQFPLDFRIDPTTGRVAQIEQGSAEEVAASVAGVLLSSPFTRTAWPTLGVDPGLFAQVSKHPEELMREVSEWEPRGPSLISVAPDVYDDMITQVRLQITTRGDA